MAKKCTIFCDIDGTLFEYRKYGTYETIPVVKIQETIDIINKAYDDGHYIILTTARPKTTREHTEKELLANNVNYHELIMGIARGTRILINDNEISNVNKAYAFCVERNQPLNTENNELIHTILS
jgi:hydroxymethylpyrimidine pyrophosphatase-like HAD family hydrolase